MHLHAQVRVSSVDPPGGVAGSQTAVTIFGSGFAIYGKAMLKCKVGNIVVDADRLLDANRLLCTLPASATIDNIPITVSLSGGADGTFSSDAASFRQ